MLKTGPGVVEIYVHTTAIRGKEGYFVADYEPPESHYLDLDTTAISVEDCLNRILAAAGKAL
jgi:hypothetical protein